jgi:hypothetical protein
MGHLGCFQSLGIVNSAAINMGVQVTLPYPREHSFGSIPMGIARSYVGSIFSFMEKQNAYF